MSDDTWHIIIRTHLPPLQPFEKRSCRTTYVLIRPVNAPDAVLPWIGVCILLITPSALEVEPIQWRAIIVRTESLGVGIEREIVRAQGRIPHRALVRLVLDHTIR